MRILRDYNLINNNTFGIEAFADFFVEIEEKSELQKIDYTEGLFVLGGGSNVLINRKLSFVVHLVYDFITILEETDEKVKINVGSGKKWDRFVEFCVRNNYYGVENLSLIPGTVGAAPVQNIGAYGVEAADVIHDVGIFDIQSKKFSRLKKEECNFDYRNSIFKNSLKGKVIITDVTFELDKKPVFKLNYGGLNKKIGANPDLKKVRQAVIEIRRSKLPDVKVTGNAGSFFKNPVVRENKLCELSAKYTDLKYFKAPGGYKIPAAWLIEKAGLKGFRHKNAAVSQKHALILVNLGNATAKEIIELAEIVKRRVNDKFGINLTEEVNIIN